MILVQLFLSCSVIHFQQALFFPSVFASYKFMLNTVITLSHSINVYYITTTTILLRISINELLSIFTEEQVSAFEEPKDVFQEWGRIDSMTTNYYLQTLFGQQLLVSGIQYQRNQNSSIYGRLEKHEEFKREKVFLI